MHQLLHLMALNRQASGRRFEAVRNDDSGDEEVTLYLYDMIVGDALTAEWYGGIDPQTYLREVLTRLPTLTNRQIKEVTPEAWSKAQQTDHQRKAA